MRIVIDLQACQYLDGPNSRALLALAQQMARSAGEHRLWVAFSNQFPVPLPSLRASFAALLPAEQIVVYDTPPPDGTAHVQGMIECIRDQFFAALGAELVFAPGLFDRPADTVGAITALPKPFLTAVGIAGEALLGDGPVATAAHAAALARAHASLAQADLLFTASDTIAGGLRAIAPRASVAAIGNAPKDAAQFAWKAIAQAVCGRLAPALPPSRLTLAYVSPLTPTHAGTAACTQALLAELARDYEIHLVVPPACPVPDSAQGFPIHTAAWFDQHAARFDRIVYAVGNSPIHQGMPALQARHPGVVILHDFFLGGLIDRLENGSAAPTALYKALFHSHGYGALAACAAAGSLAALDTYPLNKAVIDAADGVIVPSNDFIGLAETWYGAGSAASWRCLPLPCAETGTGTGSVTGMYADAIEAFARSSPAAHYRALMRALAPLATPGDPRHPALVAAARAIATNQPPLRPRQLLVDVSAMVQLDMKTGISRVVRSILLSLIDAPPPGLRIEPVYADGTSPRYRYARQFTCSLLGVEGPGLDDAPIEHRPGDVFLGLDLAPGATTRHAALLADMRNHGILLHFVVYDMLPLLQPDAFAYGSTELFRQHIATIARQADSLLCISRAVADELADWLAAHPVERVTALPIGYFHLGADLAASAPSAGLDPDAQHVFDRIAQRPTLLMVGTVEPRKGHDQALAACELLWSRKVEVNLVIVGKPGWLVDRLIRKIERHPRLGEHLFWLPGASDEMLTRLYESCSALLAASRGEGFGLPLIEAARHGLPIIARDLPVFREVGGEHAWYSDAADADALADAIETWLGLRAAGQAPQSAAMPWLNWAESARQLVASVLGEGCYRTIAASSPMPHDPFSR